MSEIITHVIWNRRQSVQSLLKPMCIAGRHFKVNNPDYWSTSPTSVQKLSVYMCPTCSLTAAAASERSVCVCECMCLCVCPSLHTSPC